MALAYVFHLNVITLYFKDVQLRNSSVLFLVYLPYAVDCPLVGSGGERQPSDAEVKAAIWEACGDFGALQLLVNLLHAKSQATKM
ncbi:hypothetical protein ACOSQ4_025407 [Xanthoceras sorbifolium]